MGKQQHWKPPLKASRRQQPKVCTVCLKRHQGTQPRGSREFCGDLCRATGEEIALLLEGNPRYAPPDVRLFLIRRAGWHCQYCGRGVTTQTANVEHMKPWPKGKTVLRNLTIACGPCNKAKFLGRLEPHVLKAVQRGLLVKL